MKTKHFITTKIIFAALTLVVLACSFSVPVYAADTPGGGPGGGSDNGGTTTDGSAGLDSCVGNDTQCICPSDKPVTDCGTDTTFQNCEKYTNKSEYAACVKNNDLVQAYLNPFIKALTFCVAIAVAIGIIIGAIKYSASGGDPQKAAAGKSMIRNAIIALLVYFILFAGLQFLLPANSLK